MSPPTISKVLGSYTNIIQFSPVVEHSQNIQYSPFTELCIQLSLGVFQILKEVLSDREQSSVKTNQLENIPSNETFHILPFTCVTNDDPG